MKFVPDRCPECGEELWGTLEDITGCALMSRDKDGEYSYTGSTEVFWDGQMTRTEGGKTILLCRGGHDWPAEKIGE